MSGFEAGWNFVIGLEVMDLIKRKSSYLYFSSVAFRKEWKIRNHQPNKGNMFVTYTTKGEKCVEVCRFLHPTLPLQPSTFLDFYDPASYREMNRASLVSVL